MRFANALRSLGVKKGTPVGIYMGMVPELPITMLACARLGAPHIVVFGGFSAESLAGRLNDFEAQVLITQDEGWRRGARVPLKRTARMHFSKPYLSRRASSCNAPAAVSPCNKAVMCGGTTALPM